MSRRPEIAPLEQRPEHGGRSGHARGGYYCSDDPNVIKWQLAGLERAGVQALFISWWGWGDSDLDGVIEGNPDAYLNRGITALLDQLAAMTSTQRIRAALIVEPFVWTQPRPRIEPRTLQPAQRAMVLDWLWINYHGKDKYREDDLLYGWNLYDEQAYIEPAVATPPRPSIGYSYVDRTCDYWQTLRAGRALGPPSRCIYIPQVTGEAAK